MNVNYAIANSIHSSVVNQSLVDSNLLIDDEGYTSLLTSLINANHTNVDIEAITESMLTYVNNNYTYMYKHYNDISIT